MRSNLKIINRKKCVIQIPSGTSSHSLITLRGKGIRKVDGIGHGDHFVHLKVRVPNNLSSTQQALMKAYAETERDTPGTIKGVTKTKSG